MSTSRTYQCLSCRLKGAIWQPPTRRSFSVTMPNARKSPYASIKQADLEEPHLRPYTEREKELLAMKYTPEQMKTIEEGEKAISAEEIAQGRMRTDPLRIKYLDDFSTLRPVLDQLMDHKAPVEHQPDTPTTGRALKENDPAYIRLTQQTGMTIQEILKLRVKNLVMHRVVNQTRMGKIQSQYYLTIAGNQNGMIGIGEGKAAEGVDGMRQAELNAIRNMKPIARYEDRTIYGEVEGKVGASIVKLSAREPGFGNRCQHLIYELARAAGIKDLAARTPRSRNKMNVVKAAFEALRSQRIPEDVARGRGRKMIDVRSVYYGGQVS